MKTLLVGTRIYNRGDIANPDHYGTITAVTSTEWGVQYHITPDPDSTRTQPYWVQKLTISPVDTGNGFSRIVTEAEHKRRMEDRS